MRSSGERRLRHDALAKVKPGPEGDAVRALLDMTVLEAEAKNFVAVIASFSPTKLSKEMLETVAHAFVRKAMASRRDR